ncbi:unnamed protein product, partial [Scytosiphon promiscuus]
CTKAPSWGQLTHGRPTVCPHHKSDISTGQVVCFDGRCQVAGCRRKSRWGLNGKQPTHCPQHGLSQ